MKVVIFENQDGGVSLTACQLVEPEQVINTLPQIVGFKHTGVFETDHDGHEYEVMERFLRPAKYEVIEKAEADAMYEQYGEFRGAWELADA